MRLICRSDAPRQAGHVQLEGGNVRLERLARSLVERTFEKGRNRAGQRRDVIGRIVPYGPQRPRVNHHSTCTDCVRFVRSF